MPTLEIKKPLAIVLDVTGPLVTKSFMTYSSETRQFLLNYYKDYVREVWGRTNLKLSVNFFRQEIESERDEARYPPLAPISAPQEEQINAFLEHLKYRFEHAWGVRSAAVGIFHLGLSEWAYKKGLLLTPVYPEVKDVLTQWKMIDGLKVYVNVGPTNFLRNVFSRTTQGNLLPLIDGHMNLLEHKSKNFIKLIQLLEMNPQDIVFITRMVEDAKLASKEKIRVVIIVREDFAPDTVAEIKGTQKELKSSKEKEKQREEKRVKKRQMHLAKSRISSTEFGGEAKHISSDYETVTSGFDDDDYEPCASSISNTDDIRDFPVIVKLDDLKWLPN